MFRPIKKIFTYIQKNASNGTMFGSTKSINSSNDSSNGSMLAREHQEEPAEQKVEQQQEEDDIERQIKTSIIDASKVNATKSKVVLPLQLQLDDELADFAHEPITLGVAAAAVEDDDDELDEQFLELDNFPNNEIIVLSDGELNSSLASDNISEDPLAIDDFTQPLARAGGGGGGAEGAGACEEEDNDVIDVEVENNGDLLWLKLDTPATVAAEIIQTSPAIDTKPVATKTKEEELRSDGGSDSGLGSENDRHNNSTTTTAVTATATTSTTTTTTTTTLPLRSNLKRRLEDDGMELSLVPEMATATAGTQKRSKRSINFDSVKVYYFPRQQGFSCVPTAGGCTLGMGARHIAFKTMTLTEHAAELRRAHRSQNQEQQQQQLQTRGSSSDDSEESEEDYLSEGSGSDADDGSNGFLQPVTPKQRRALLKAAGVRKIDASEKIDCRDIRNSREVCGCSCREFCDPETCACSQAGIKCQVDRAMFPCGCTREACGNTVGRVEFNPTRVRTHYIHTVMRLDMEQRQSQGPSSSSNGGSTSSTLIYGTSSNSSSVVAGVDASTVVVGGATTASGASHCYFMQPQSNYSSGYASPAYTPETSVSFYQQQQQPPQVTPPQATGSSAVSTNADSHANGSSSNGGSVSQQSSYAASYPQLDSLDSGLFASGSNVTPSYGELLTPTYHPALSYGSAQLNSYTTYQQTSPVSGSVSPGAYSSCAVPSVRPYGNATTTASNATQYQHANALETTAAASMNVRSSSSSSISLTASSCSTGLTRLTGPADFISLNAPLNSSSRLSQINDLLQHNRNTTVALVAVSEGYAASSSSSRSRTSTTNSSSTTTTIDSIDTPPIVEEAQRSNCMTFEELPPSLINPAPIVAVVEQHVERKHLSVSIAPQPRQPIDASVALTNTLSSTSSSSSEGI